MFVPVECDCQLFYIRIYRQHTTDEGVRSVQKLWSFYYRFIGLMFDNLIIITVSTKHAHIVDG